MSTQLDIPGCTRHSWASLTASDARRLLESFEASKLDVAQWCRRNGYARAGLVKTMRRLLPTEWTRATKAARHKQTPYRLGAALEYRTRNHLTRAGYNVLRSLGSRGPADLVALKQGQLLLIQCKRGGYLAPADRLELVQLADSVGATAILASTPTGNGIEFSRLTTAGAEDYRP